MVHYHARDVHWLAIEVHVHIQAPGVCIPKSVGHHNYNYIHNHKYAPHRYAFSATLHRTNAIHLTHTHIFLPQLLHLHHPVQAAACVADRGQQLPLPRTRHTTRQGCQTTSSCGCVESAGATALQQSGTCRGTEVSTEWAIRCGRSRISMGEQVCVER